MGAAKALLDHEGASFLERIAGGLAQAGIAPRIVVTGSHDGPIREALPSGVIAITNPAPDRGMLSSAQIGVRALLESAPAGVTGIMVCLVDHPAVAPATYRRLLEEHVADVGAILVPRYRDRNGHPLLLPGDLLEGLLALDPTGELRTIVRSNPDRVRRVETEDAGVCQDIDTPDDLRRLRDR